MTESSEDGNYLVRVRAQVMSRDDSSGGWVPLGGGGLSNVSVRKRPRPQGSAPGPPDKPKHDYLIYGKRISDNSVVLSCTIKKDFEYNKVMPTFHHWRTGDKKFGLTFHTAADARAFDKGVRTAIEDLLDGFTDTSPTAPLPKCPHDVGDDDVFMTLDLPQDPKDSRSSTDSNSSGRSDHKRRIAYVTRDKQPPDPSRHHPVYDAQKGENYPYVQLTAVHDYLYPSDEQQHKQPPPPPHYLRRVCESPCDLKKAPPAAAAGLMTPPPRHPPLPVKQAIKKAPQRCRHCNEVFSQERNSRGSCEYGPDPVANAIDTVTCMSCLQCAMYHCAADAEGDYAGPACPCAAAGRREADRGDDDACRWLGFAFFALLVPCLWLYPPLKMCHWCGTRCGMCGGRHKAAVGAADK
ncbi:sprouty-related, EVH1 domain-containing protein 1 isoform X2 [Cylas formicarius]|uniref:sprouty-related, EVH1 domain-containing protein 1 isoform X2 n=1 Tax=Cylas formicarius TaxID=197179 RepID=UPI00295850B0|nr:sprouty-related, EVH1 domain-containing protein 1 isoform X2 [Cylas formicarius]